MHYTISNISHKSHDLDEHTVYFDFDVNFIEPEPAVVVKYHYGYGQLMHYLKTAHPEFAKYLESVRSSIDGWGPCQHKVMAEIGEEAQEQLYQYLEEYLLQADWVPKLLEWHKNLLNQTPQQQEKTEQAAKKIVKTLGGNRQAMMLSQKRYFKFCETVERQIRQTAVEVYPELMEGSPEQIKEFKYLFVSEIQAMQSKIEKMLMANESKT
jgi:hypothetical protein